MDSSREKRLQLAVDAAGMDTFVWYVEDRTEPDQRMLELFNLPIDGTLSLEPAITTMIHPDDRNRYADAVAAALDPRGGSLAGTGTTMVLIAAPDGLVGSILELTGMTAEFGVRPHLPTPESP